MADKLICPECKHENDSHMRLCADCGAVLVGNTTIWKADLFADQVRQPVPVRPAIEFEADTLYLYIVGSENNDPLRFSGTGSITLGRSNQDTAAVTNLLDLNPYHAFSLGVSRQHARINHDETGYTIEDLNSSNGTRLNGNRLEPGRMYRLRTGDHVQLGDLLIFAYYA